MTPIALHGNRKKTHFNWEEEGDTHVTIDPDRNGKVSVLDLHNQRHTPYAITYS